MYSCVRVVLELKGSTSKSCSIELSLSSHNIKRTCTFMIKDKPSLIPKIPNVITIISVFGFKSMNHMDIVKVV